MTTPSPQPTPAAPKPLVAWSYSALAMFENCPRKYWAVKIKKINDDNPYSMAGEDDHQAFDMYLKKGLALPRNLSGYQVMVDKIRDARGSLASEKLLCLDLNFNPCGYRDWDHAWVRGAGDVIKVDGDTIRYFDWKRGKYRESDDQIELTSLLLFQHYPEVQRVVGGLIFYKANRVHPHIVLRSDAPMLWNGWLSRVRELEEAKKADLWPATPNPLCAYCPYMACQHNTVEARLKRERGE